MDYCKGCVADIHMGWESFWVGQLSRMINFVAHQLLDRTEISELHVMIAALQDHIVLTKKLNLHFVAQLLTMACLLYTSPSPRD